MELTPKQKFSAINDRHTNIKECEGLIIAPVAYHTHQYDDADGKTHTVLVILNGKDNEFYKTEVQAFIDKFVAYQESFGQLPDEEKPDIKIVLRTSKKNNRYVNFELAD